VVLIGVPRETKDHEARVGLVPSGVLGLRQAGHRVLIQAGAGEGSSLGDGDYRKAGAEIVQTAAEVWGRAEMVVKVKEPLPDEYRFLRPDLILSTYLHLAPLPKLTQALLDARVNAVAYETIRDDDGSLPLLTPMSEVAGRMSVQIGAHYLETGSGGRGVLLGGVPGVAPAEVVILGGGVVGTNAAKIAVGAGARVTILDRNLDRLRELDDLFRGRLVTLASNPLSVAEAVSRADLVIGAVLIPGASAPRLVTREMVAAMKPGSVIVDVAIDQGGCVETARPTTFSDPVYSVDDVLHYCVTNMPAATPHTSTFALTNATFPYVRLLAEMGLDRAIAASRPLRQGINTYRGRLVHPAVAESQGLACQPLSLA